MYFPSIFIDHNSFVLLQKVEGKNLTIFWFSKKLGYHATAQRIFENMKDEEKGMNVVNAQMVFEFKFSFEIGSVSNIGCHGQIANNIQRQEDKEWFSEYVRQFSGIPSVVSAVYVELIYIII